MPERRTAGRLLPTYENFGNRIHSGTSRHSRLGPLQCSRLEQVDKIDVASMAKPLPEKNPAHVRVVLGRCRIVWADICRSIGEPSCTHRNHLEVSADAQFAQLKDLPAAIPVISLD